MFTAIGVPIEIFLFEKIAVDVFENISKVFGMFEAHEVNAEHKDLIHDVAHDYYGRRMATCSSDQYVKVSKKQ